MDFDRARRLAVRVPFAYRSPKPILFNPYLLKSNEASFESFRVLHSCVKLNFLAEAGACLFQDNGMFEISLQKQLGSSAVSFR